MDLCKLQDSCKRNEAESSCASRAAYMLLVTVQTVRPKKLHMQLSFTAWEMAYEAKLAPTL